MSMGFGVPVEINFTPSCMKSASLYSEILINNFNYSCLQRRYLKLIIARGLVDWSRNLQNQKSIYNSSVKRS